MSREVRVSVAGWIVRHWVIPRLFPKRAGLGNELLADIAADRARGPSLPSPKVRGRRRFSERAIGGVRTLTLAPATAAGPQRILYIHGGAYVFDMMDIQWTIASGLVDRTNGEILVPLYPLAPESTVDAGLAAVEAVYLKLVEEVGAANICVLGDSAGGGLALTLAHHLIAHGKPLPASLVLYFPWLDATVSGKDQPVLARKDPLLDIDRLRACGRMWAGGRDPGDPLVSPLFATQEGLPPTLVLTGTHDLLVSDTRRFAQASPQAVVREYPQMFHGWIAGPIPEARSALEETRTFIARHAPRGQTGEPPAWAEGPPESRKAD